MKKNVFLVIFSVVLGLQAYSQRQPPLFKNVNGVEYRLEYSIVGEGFDSRVLPEFAYPTIDYCKSVYNGHLEIDVNIPKEIFVIISVPINDGRNFIEMPVNFPVQPPYITFSGCANDITSITIGANHNLFYMNVQNDFSKLPNLFSIEVAEGNKYYSSENGVLYENYFDKNRLIYYPPQKIGENFAIPEGVTGIASGAFVKSGLTTITIPESVTKIDRDDAFGCSISAIEVAPNNKDFSSENGVLYNKDKTELICYPAKKIGESFVVPESVTRISQAAFRCSNLTSITIHENITTIVDGAFANCTNLASIINLNPVPVSFLWGIGYNPSTILYVPAGSKEAYQNAEIKGGWNGWKHFANIVEIGSEDKDPKEDTCKELEENPDPNYSYRYFLWGGIESKTKPAKGVNHYRVTFYKGNPTALDKYKCN